MAASEAITVPGAASLSTLSAVPARRAARRLMHDRRYGWIFDEYKDPLEEALAGGRGMFCITTIATFLVKTVSNSVTVAADAVVAALKNPREIPRAFHTSTRHILQPMGFVQKFGRVAANSVN